MHLQIVADQKKTTTPHSRQYLANGALMTRPVTVIIATNGRPNELANLLDALALQTVPPDLIVVSACDHADIDERHARAGNVQVVFGPRGLTTQRNKALSLVRGQYDTVVFFDDDFIPSRFWIEHAQLVLATYPDVVCVTGKVLLDGVLLGGIGWLEGRSLVDKADASQNVTMVNCRVKNQQFPYGCNMAFRAKNIEHRVFDERLVRYGWLEDRDFSVRAGGQMIWTDALWGVHLGTTRGRPSGLSFGYSQIVNPLYLVGKGTMTILDASRVILRALAGNAIGNLSPSSHIDRWGRLKGNIIALKDVLLGRLSPEKAAEL